MRNMKAAAVLTTAALLALGASFTSMAAEKGTWDLVDGEWVCYDKDGEVYEDTFCLSNGVEYYVNEDGVLEGNRWVEDDGDYYYVSSSGAKVINDWRYAAPADDEDEDEQWFYFGSKGKRTEDKKLVINGKTYFFGEDGAMLTGWVQEVDDVWAEAANDDVKNVATYYCGEDGARVESDWVETFAPGTDEDDQDDADEYWYYLQSSGKAKTGKASSIDGLTYLFNNQGQMLTGWVAYTNSEYVEIWEEDNDDLSSISAIGGDIYLCREDGHVKNGSGWVKEWNNKKYGLSDSDVSKKWFYVNSNGKIYIPDSVTYTDVQKYTFEDGEGRNFNVIWDGDGNAYDATEKKVNGKTYLFNENGEMVSGFQMIDGKMYYYGGSNDGVRKDGSMNIEDENGASFRFYFATSDDPADGYYNAAGINGNKSGKLYENGLLVKAVDQKYELVTVDGKQYIVNKSGTIQSSAKEYEEDDDVLIDATNATFYDDGVDAWKNSVTGAIER